MRQVMREEKKYLIDLSEFRSYKATLDQILTQDSHNGQEGYQVRSLYFDTLYNKDFNEKEDGVEIRRKIRLRIYGPADEFALLEMKQKQGEYQVKRSLKITREDAIRLMRADYSPLLKYEEAFAKECFSIMMTQVYRPKCIVEYTRRAYIVKENKTRITFDYNIVATESCLDLFSTHLNMDPVLAPTSIVLEIKYNSFLLNYVKDLLGIYEKEQTSISKYILGRKINQRYKV